MKLVLEVSKGVLTNAISADDSVEITLIDHDTKEVVFLDTQLVSAKDIALIPNMAELKDYEDLRG